MIKRDFWSCAYNRLTDLYGEEIDVRILNRFYSEKNWINDISNEWFLDVLVELCRNAKENSQKIQVLGSYGSLFISYLLGITNENPIPLHYYCPKCKRVEFVDELLSPMDLEPKPCACGAKMIPDGYDVPFQLFNGHIGHSFASVEVTKDYLEIAKSVISSYPSFKEYIPEVTETTVREVLDKLNMKVKSQVIVDLVVGRYSLIR